MTAVSSSPLMRFLLHPFDSMATFFRSRSTGLSPEKLAEYDARILHMAQNGDVTVYSSAEVAMDTILGKNVPASDSKGTGKTNQKALCK